jgi:23S rRNA (uracil1939-C5)-methyltransferase
VECKYSIEKSMKKGDQLTNLYIETMAAEGKTLAKVDGIVIFLQGGAPGDTVTASLTKIKKSYLEGRVVSIEKLSEKRAAPFCEHFGICGGCSWQHVNYETQLFYKQQQVVDNLERIGGLTFPQIKPIIPSDQIKNYRNKLDFTFTASRWLTFEEMKADVPFGESALGFHIPKTFDKVFDVKHCHLQPEPSNAIRLHLKKIASENRIDFFDLRNQNGYLRTVMIRTANTGEVMVILQVAYHKQDWLEFILTSLSAQFPSITSIQYVVNEKRNDTFADLEVVCWKGKPYITETMPSPNGKGILQFRIGPKSFYQTNSAQAYKLYKAAFDLAELTGTELVYDLYTGTGTIANFIAGHTKKVIGLEYVDSAIEDAKVNATINGRTNCDFYAGDIKSLLSVGFLQINGKPEVIITDPPRVGMHEDVCKILLEAAPNRIIYISCNAATQARDLKILCENYQITAVQPVDMFPQTAHVENIVRLDKK